MIFLLAIVYLLMLGAVGCAALGAYFTGVALVLLAAFIAQAGGLA